MARCLRTKYAVYLALALAVWASDGLAFFPSPQTDPFYLRLLEKAQKSFLAKSYADSARDFEIAAFGLDQDPTLQARAYFYLGLSHFYLRNSEKSANFLRRGVELLGDQSLDVLGIPESVLPDLETVLTFFNIELRALMPSSDSRLPQEGGKAEESDPNSGKDSGSPQATKKEPAQDSKANPGPSPPITLDRVKEGDIIPLDLVDTLPAAIERVPAIYPSSARGTGIAGTVTVNALISEKGKVIKTEIIHGIKGIYGFNQAAEQAVRRWKFEPATIKGIKVRVWLPIRIVFKKPE